MVYKDTDDRTVELDEMDVMADPDIYYVDERMETFGERLGDDTLEAGMIEDSELGGDEAIASDEVEKGFGESIGPDNPHVGDQLEDIELSGEAEADFAGDDGTIREESIMEDKTVEE